MNSRKWLYLEDGMNTFFFSAQIKRWAVPQTEGGNAIERVTNVSFAFTRKRYARGGRGGANWTCRLSMAGLKNRPSFRNLFGMHFTASLGRVWITESVIANLKVSQAVSTFLY